MKRFLVFLGHNYYPNGGMADFFNCYDSLEEARKELELKLDEFRKSKHFNFRGNSSYYHSDADGWWEIFDLEKMEFAAKSYDDDRDYKLI